jgi:hypothetical protein
MVAAATTPKTVPKLKLRPPDPTEDAIHAAIASALDTLLLPPAMWTTFPAGQIELNGQQAAKLHRMGMKRGWPDILVVYCSMARGIEVKKPGGILSKRRIVRSMAHGRPRIVEGQAETFPKLMAAGMPIAIVHSVEEALGALQCWGIPTRGVS